MDHTQLEVTEGRNSVEQHLVFPLHCLQLSGDEIGMTDRRSQHFDALLNGTWVILKMSGFTHPIFWPFWGSFLGHPFHLPKCHEHVNT